MLYFKLPDSIRSSVARSAHDCYVYAKKSELKEAKGEAKKASTRPAQGASSVSSSEEEDEEEDEGSAAASHARPAPPSRAKLAWPRAARRLLMVRCRGSEDVAVAVAPAAAPPPVESAAGNV